MEMIAAGLIGVVIGLIIGVVIMMGSAADSWNDRAVKIGAITIRGIPYKLTKVISDE